MTPHYILLCCSIICLHTHIGCRRVVTSLEHMDVVNFLHFSGLFSNSIMQGQVKLRGSRKSPSWGWSLHLVSLATTWFFVHYCAKEYRRESGTPFSTWYAQLIGFWSFTYSQLQQQKQT